MSSPREHHYVPQFYLREFSADGKRIHLLNIDRKKIIYGASIKHQCSRRKFYDYNPNVEKSFGDLENYTAKTIRSILDTATLPSIYSEDHFTILVFIVLQRARTMQAACKNDAITDTLAKLTLEGHPELKDIDLTKYKIRDKFPVALPLSVSAQAIPHTLDLGMHLFFNDSNEDFITSDDPVVLHNQYCEGVDYRGVCGWSCSGLQVIYPLSPKMALFLYDQRVYKVGSRRGGSTSIISNANDVEQLNAFQILNAANNVYFGEGTDGEGVQRQAISLSLRRRKERVKFVRTERISVGEGESELIHLYETLLPYELRLSHVSVRRRMRRIPVETRATMIRDQPIETAQTRPGRGDGWLRYPIRRDR